MILNIQEQTKRKTYFLATIVLVISGIGGYLFLDYQFKNSIDEQLQAISDSTGKLFDLRVKDEKKILEFRLESILLEDGLAKAIAMVDYGKIHSIVSPHYSRLKELNEDIKILTFRSPKGITLYRAHKPEFYGDTLNKKRKLIIDTNNVQRSFSGFEVGKLEMTYRITKAIFYENRYVGNVELGVSPNSFIKNLSSIFKFDIGIAIDNSLYEVMIKQNGIPIDNKYTLIKGSEHLKNHITEVDEVSHFRLKMDIPLQNHISEAVGYLVLGFNVSIFTEKNKIFMYKLFFMGVFVALLLAFVLHKGFGIMLRHFIDQIYIDALTGLENRHALNDALSSEYSQVLILSNIKEFSLINEFYGVDVGNKILIQVAAEFKSFADEHQFGIYRISSDEYVILKQEENFEEDKYIKLIELLHKKINSLNLFVDGVDESISIEIYSGITVDHEHSLEDAQMALKKAKQRSLPFLMYSMQVDTKEHSYSVMQIKRTVRYALEHKNVVPFFQKITNRDGKTVKYEALIRIIEFNNGEKTILTPDEFLDISMQSGLYINIEKEMIEQSLAFFADRKEKISINFLPNDFFNAAIIDTLMKGIELFDSPQRIVIEITEQEGVEDFDRLIVVVERLRKLGVEIAIDDFGSGYANYVHILRIRPNYIKIDGSLIKNILTDFESQILVKSIIQFAKELDITIIAEYVENKDVFEMLKMYGVDEFQGYYFGKPTDFLGIDSKS